jgi:chromosome segregation ATPase
MKDGFNALRISDDINSRDVIRKQIENELASLESIKKEINSLSTSVNKYKKKESEAVNKYLKEKSRLEKIIIDNNSAEKELEKLLIIIDDKKQGIKILEDKEKELEVVSDKNKVIFEANFDARRKIINNLEDEIVKLSSEIELLKSQRDGLRIENSEYIKQNKEIEQIKLDVVLKKEELKDLNKRALKLKLAVLTEMSNTSGAERTQ